MIPVRPIPPTVARKRSGSTLPRALEHAAVGDLHAQPRDVAAEAAVAVVIPAVNVGRHHPAHRDELRAGGDRHEPAARQEQPVNVAQRQAGLGAQQAGLRVPREDPVRQCRRRDLPIARRRQGRIAVRAAQPARERHPAGRSLEVLRAHFARRHDGRVAPSRQKRFWLHARNLYQRRPERPRRREAGQAGRKRVPMETCGRAPGSGDAAFRPGSSARGPAAWPLPSCCCASGRARP